VVEARCPRRASSRLSTRRRPLRSTGSGRARSPASSLLWGAVTPCRPSRRASFPSLGDTTVSSVVRPRRPRTWAADQPGVGKPGLQPAVTIETARSPKFPWNPFDHSPCSPTPARPGSSSGPRSRLPDAAPASDNDEGSPRGLISGLNRTAFDLAVYASQRRSPATTQDSLPAAGPALPGGIGHPQGSNERFHIVR